MLKKSPQTWEYLYDNPEVYDRLKKMDQLAWYLEVFKIGKID